MGAALAGDDGRVAQQPGHRRAVQGRRHHQQAQVLAQAALAVQAQGQGQIGMKTTLVEFVENDQSHPIQRRVALQPAGQNALGQHLDPGLARHLAIKTDAIAHGLADRFAPQAGHARRRRPRRQPARLQQQDRSPGQPRLVQQRQRDAGGLAGARRRLQDQSGSLAQRGPDFRQGRFDGQQGGIGRGWRG